MSEDGPIGGTGEDDRVLVAEYVLGLLPPAEHLRMAARMAAEPGLAAERRVWELRLASLDREFAEAPAPASVLPRIEARLFGPALARTGLWESLALWRGVAAAAVAVAAIVLGLTVLNLPRPLAGQMVTALQDEAGGVSFMALYDPASGSVRLTALTPAPSAEQDYELWAIQGGGAPVSMGVVPVTGPIVLKLPPQVLQGFGAGSTLAVTLEQKGGSPTGAPQGPVVAQGVVSAI